MTELTHVISSSVLKTDALPAQPVECARTAVLGLSCLRGTGYGCLCELVTSAEVGVTTDKQGNAAVLRLALTLGTGTPYDVMAALNLTGLVAGFEASRTAVIATYDLRKAQNGNLRSFLIEAANSS